MFSKLAKWILKKLGWKITGNYPQGYRKSICIVAPHTSNWDFPLGILVRSAIEVKTGFIAKHTLFTWPFGYLFKALGGYPVDRSKKSNFVDGIVDLFEKNETMHIALAPEGTRKKVDKFKTGFYFIALNAHIPVFLVRFDYEHRQVSFSDPFIPTGDLQKDMDYIYTYYSGVKGKNPAKSFTYIGHMDY